MIGDILSRTFGGLKKDYFVRNLVIGLIFSAPIWVMIDALETRATNQKPFWDMFFIKAYFSLMGLLYPYAKFLYDYIWELIIGDTTYFYSINIITVWFKLFTRIMCWGFAWVLAPIGLLILYFKNS
ncbi:MAG: hypothetical protein GX896_04800 [Clostridiales bacterium]|nr:hypothetical protein [Clostridiales bacterium]